MQLDTCKHLCELSLTHPPKSILFHATPAPTLAPVTHLLCPLGWHLDHTICLSPLQTPLSFLHLFENLVHLSEPDVSPAPLLGLTVHPSPSPHPISTTHPTHVPLYIVISKLLEKLSSIEKLSCLCLESHTQALFVTRVNRSNLSAHQQRAALQNEE